MRSKEPRILLPLLVVFLLAAMQIGSAAQANSASSQEVRLQALNVVRVFNTAEIETMAAAKHYVSFEEIVKSGRLPEMAKRYRNANWTGVDFQTPEPVPGWQLRLVVAPDGQSYKLSLIQKDGACRFGYFSDEAGIIYHGKAIDCPVD